MSIGTSTVGLLYSCHLLHCWNGEKQACGVRIFFSFFAIIRLAQIIIGEAML